MRGNFSQIAKPEDNVAAVLHQQGALLTDADLNQQNVNLQQRIRLLEHWLIAAAKKSDGSWGEAPKIKVDVLAITGTGNTELVLPHLVDVTTLGLVDISKLEDEQHKLKRPDLQQISQVNPLVDATSYYLYCVVDERVLTTELLRSRNRRSIQPQSRLVQRPFLQVRATELKSKFAPELTVSKLVNAADGHHRIEVHRMDLINTTDGEYSCWLKYAHISSPVYSAKIDGNAIVGLDVRHLRSEHARIEFVEAVGKDLVEDSATNTRDALLYKWEDGGNGKVLVTPEPGPNQHVPVVSPGEKPCHFIIWDDAKRTKFVTKVDAELKVTLSDHTFVLKKFANADVVTDGPVLDAAFRWSVTIPVRGGTVVGEPDRVFPFMPDRHFKRLATFSVDANDAFTIVTMANGITGVTVAPGTTGLGLSIRSTPKVAPESVPSVDAVVGLEQPVYSSIGSTTPPNVRPVPIESLGFNFHVDEVRKWARSTELPEVAGLSADELAEKIRRSVHVASEHDSAFMDDVRNFAVQIEAEVAAQTSPVQPTHLV